MTIWLRLLSPEEAWWFFLGLNVLIVILSALGNGALRVRSRERFTGRDQALSTGDAGLVAGCVLLNSLVSVAGWWLWTEGLIQLRPSSLGATLATVALFLLLMDLLMYITHRMAHWPAFYRWFHHRHHQHQDTNPLSLFVLHPFEVLAFGATLLGSIWLVRPTAEALGTYLFLNIVFGSLGHADADLFPAKWSRSRLGSWLGLGKFHADHHYEEGRNFGFYTAIWDRWAGTWHRRIQKP